MDPASVIEEFGTTYGNMMFGEAGIYQLTPAASGRCGMLIQKQYRFHPGLQDTFEFTQAATDGWQEDGAEIRKQGDGVEYASLEVFANLVNAVGNFCNFDKRSDATGKLGTVSGSNCLSMGKIDQAAEYFMLQMRNHFFGETSDQGISGGSTLVLVVALFERTKQTRSQGEQGEEEVREVVRRQVGDAEGVGKPHLALDIDGKGVCNEAIEELLLAPNAATMATAAG
jgi:hypothetical protein